MSMAGRYTPSFVELTRLPTSAITLVGDLESFCGEEMGKGDPMLGAGRSTKMGMVTQSGVSSSYSPYAKNKNVAG
jgi:hypothetical protein